MKVLRGVAVGLLLSGWASVAYAQQIDPGYQQLSGSKPALLALTTRFLCPTELADGALELVAARNFRTGDADDVACSYGSKTGLGFATFHWYPGGARDVSSELKETTDLIASRAGIRRAPQRLSGEVRWGGVTVKSEEAQIAHPDRGRTEAVWLATYRNWRIKARQTYAQDQRDLIGRATAEFMALQTGAVAQLDACAAQQPAFDVNKQAKVLQGSEATAMAGVMALAVPDPQPMGAGGCAIAYGDLSGGKFVVIRSYGAGQVIVDARVEGDATGAVLSVYRMDLMSMQPSLGGLLVRQSEGETIVYKAYGAPPGPGQSVADIAAALNQELRPMARIKGGKITLSMPDAPAGR
jgi:hypothetical protein